MSAPTFDLQSHSVHSDGELSPAAVIGAAADAGVEIVALTDHDTVDGVEEALAAAEGRHLRVLPAVEISALRAPDVEVHILGYGLNHTSPQLRRRLEEFRADRELRAERMIERLAAAGLAVDRSPLRQRQAAGSPIGRPHLAAAALAVPENAPRLAEEGIADVTAFIRAYLIPGKPGYQPRLTPTVPEAIDAIHDAGGVAVWAHPFWDVEAAIEVIEEIDRFVEAGLDGVECFYATHTADQARLLAARCRELRLISTGSADFHGPCHKLFSSFRAFELHGCEPQLGQLA